MSDGDEVGAIMLTVGICCFIFGIIITSPVLSLFDWGILRLVERNV